MIKHMIRNRMFVVKLHLSANQRTDIGRKPLNKQWWLSREYGAEHTVIYIIQPWV